MRCWRRVRVAGHDLQVRRTAAESKYVEIKQHREEQQWSPVVYFDRPRCNPVLSLRTRLRRRHGCVGTRDSESRRGCGHCSQNGQDHLNCEECGMCIDLCPVGALTSGTYRYKTRPWEMEPHRHHLHALAAMAAKRRWACAAVKDGTEIIQWGQPRQERHQRRFLM